MNRAILKYKVSVIIPSYNGKDYLSEAIDSVLDQTFKNTEIIVVDDGSNDDGETKRIVESYGDRIVYLEKENGGVSSALNFGLTKAKGDFVIWLSHDDLLCKKSIESKIIKWVKTKDAKTIIGSKTLFINDKSKKIHRAAKQPKNIDKPSDLLKRHLNGCSLLIPIGAFKNHSFDTNFRYMPDYFMWAELLENNYKITILKKKNTCMRLHSKQVTNTVSELYEKEFAVFFEKYIKPLEKSKKFHELKGVYVSLATRFFRYGFYSDYCEAIIKWLKDNYKYSIFTRIRFSFAKSKSKIAKIILRK